MSMLEWFGSKVFDLVHQNNLVYNTCWEDPRLDREVLELGPDDTVMVITSAGCNALDYLLDGPKHVYAVDMNPRQNALLELKAAGIKHLEYEDFFAMFGKGKFPRLANIYRDTLRPSLSPWSREFWDSSLDFFDDTWQRSFYFRGTSGTFAQLINIYIDHVVRLRPAINELLEAKTVEEQREIYDKRLRNHFWTDLIKFVMSRDFTLSLLGVPPAQRFHLENQYPGGIVQFIEDCLEAVFAKLPLADNYFWRVYLTGEYTHDCRPNYLVPENFYKLKAGLIDRVSAHTNPVQTFLEQHPGQISRFILLDHMDWMVGKNAHFLQGEWQAIVERAAPKTRVLWRSGGLRTEFVDEVEVRIGERTRRVGEMLTYHRPLAERLHELDRVHTYGSFFIADLKV